MADLTHLDEYGRARMVDVTAKPATERRATATGEVRMRPDVVHAISSGGVPKGDVAAAARIAGITAAKRTWELIPLCHQVPLTSVDVTLELLDDRVVVRAEVTAVGQTGVEMEALTAVSAACLTVYDMCKALDREMVISDVKLLLKTGGVHGGYVRRDEGT
ncbi:MAG: cyclic pyranopterin monophosphate synthase MoaC [Armatimonadota bacterium]